MYISNIINNIKAMAIAILGPWTVGVGTGCNHVDVVSSALMKE